jgi:hypothetical protein
MSQRAFGSGHAFARVWPLAITLASLPACTSFSAVRPARVTPGSSVTLQLSYATPPGDDAAWFWSFDCEASCNRSILSYDLGYTNGFDAGGTPFEMGFGISGTYPYATGYAQLGQGRVPWGIGLRVGVPAGWHEHQAFVRLAVPLGERTNLLLSPMLFLHTGNSPNGQNPGTFLGLIQGLGLEARGERFTAIPALSLVAGRTQRESYGREVASSWTVFGTASISLTVHKRRS